MDKKVAFRFVSSLITYWACTFAVNADSHLTVCTFRSQASSTLHTFFFAFAQEGHFSQYVI